MKINCLRIYEIIQKGMLIIVLICFDLIAQENVKGMQELTSVQTEFNTVRAVIVGVSNYMNIQSLEYAHKDAIAFYDYVRSPAGGSVDSSNIKLLINEYATAAQIFGALDWILSESGEGDLAIFYFSGHGDLETKTIRQNGFLLAYDAPEAAYMAGGTIGINYLQDYLETIVQKSRSSVILISDACKSGKLAGGLEGVMQTTAALQENWKNIIKILSSQPGELSYEDKNWGSGAGVFTYYLLRGLMGMADLNSDKHVSLKELDIYLSTKIPPETDYKQNPSIVGNAKAILTDVDSLTFATLMKEEKGEPVGELLAMKGNETSASSLDSSTSNLINQFKSCLKNGALIYSIQGYNAWDIYSELKNREDLKPVVSSMKNSLIASLQDKSQIVINSFLNGKTEEADTINLNSAYEELSYAFSLIDENYILYDPIKAKYLFMESLFYYENEFEQRINLLNECINIQPDAAYAYCELGRACHDAKRYDEAIANYGKAIELSPRWKYPYYNVGIVYADLTESEKAIENYSKAIEIDPDYADAYNNLGLIYYNKGDQSKAIEYYNKAVETYPGYKLAYYNLGIVYSDIGEIDKAIENYSKTIEIDPYYTDAYNNLGLIYKNKGDQSKAIEYFNKAVEVDPKYKLAYYNLGTVYSNIGEIDKAIENYISTVELDANYIEAYYSLGIIYSDIGEIEKAIENYIGTVELDANYTEAYYNLGIIYSDIGEINRAIEYYSKAIEVNPDYTDAYNNLGLIYYNKGDQSKAIEYFNKAVEVDPKYKLAYYNLGIVYSDIGEIDKAIENYSKAIEIDPDYTSVYNNLGILYYNKGDQSKAIEYYNIVVDIDPNHKWAYYNLGLVYIDAGDNDKAVKNFNKCLQIDPNYINAYSKLGTIYYENKDYDSGIKIYNKYIEFYPHDYYGYQMRGLNYFYKGDFQNSLIDLNKVIEIIPNQPDGYYNLACYYSVTNNSSKSLEFLEKAFINGYSDFDDLGDDPDLDNIRSHPDYIILIQKYSN